jgi:hypothetical protein
VTRIQPLPNEKENLMETAKVDIRKLQLLNDRINQCIDALNQVRVSVHGLSHASVGAQSPLGVPLTQAPYGQSPYGAAAFGAGYAPGFIQPQTGFQPGFAPQYPVGIGQGFNPVLGLSHTSQEGLENRPVWTDPQMAARIAQTFPYLYLSVSPAVGTIY